MEEENTGIEAGSEPPEENESFDIIGVQIGMRRQAVRSESFVAVRTSINDVSLWCFRAEIVDPAVVEGEAPSIMHVLIPVEKCEMIIIEPKPPKAVEEKLAEVAEGNGGGVDDEEDLAAQRDRALADEEDTADEHDGEPTASVVG